MTTSDDPGAERPDARRPDSDRTRSARPDGERARSAPAPDPSTVPLPLDAHDAPHPVPEGVDSEDEAAWARLPAGCALLVAHRGPHREGRFLLDKDRTSAGRDRAADIVLDDVTVSRKHAEFVRVAGVFEVRDLGSLNGTYVNRLRVDAATLRDGDLVRVGAFRLVFLAHRPGGR